MTRRSQKTHRGACHIRRLITPCTPAIVADPERSGKKSRAFPENLNQSLICPISFHACAHARTHTCLREDPFELKEANHDFFQMECCRESLSFAFPPCSPVGEPMDPPLSHHPTSWYVCGEAGALENQQQIFLLRSLCRVGPALLYRRDAGLTFEGFLPGYNHLSVLNVPCHYYPISSNSRRPLPATSSSTAPQAAFAASPALLHRPPNSAAGFNTLMSALSDELAAIHSALGEELPNHKTTHLMPQLTV